MLQIIVLCGLVGVALDTTRTIRRQRALFAEFGQSTATMWLVWLYPLPLVAPMFYPLSATYLLFPLPLGILFFLPAIAVAVLNRHRFQRAGTNRVDPAERAVDRVIMSGILAIITLLSLTVILGILSRMAG